MSSAEEVSLRRFGSDRDGALFVDWLHRPHVTRWWGDPDVQHASSLPRPPGADHAMILCGETPVGYVRWQRAKIPYLKTLGLGDIPEGAMDIDILLGEPDYAGRGIGTRALELLVGRLRSDPTVPAAGMSTSVDNAPAIRAYEKAGFAKFRPYEDPDFGPCWIMITYFDRSDASPPSSPSS